MVRWGWRGTVLAVLAATGACSGSGRGAIAVSTTLAPASRPSLAIETHMGPFVDLRRSTEPVGSTPALPNRSLPTEITFPSAGQPGRPYPLIVFGHGNGGTGDSNNLLQRAWARAGYVVAAPTFPFGAGRAPSGPGGAVDYPNQPARHELRDHRDAPPQQRPRQPLYGVIDPSRIGAAGYSLGATTTLALAGNTCCYDPRVKAAAVLAGGEIPIAGGDFWIRIHTPVLFVHGEADPTVLYRFGLQAFKDAPPPKFFVTIVGGGHAQPYSGQADDAQSRVVIDTTLDFFDRYLKGTPDGLARLQSDATVAGVARATMCVDLAPQACQP